MFAANALRVVTPQKSYGLSTVIVATRPSAEAAEVPRRAHCVRVACAGLAGLARGSCLTGYPLGLVPDQLPRA